MDVTGRFGIDTFTRPALSTALLIQGEHRLNCTPQSCARSSQSHHRHPHCDVCKPPPASSAAGDTRESLCATLQLSLESPQESTQGEQTAAPPSLPTHLPLAAAMSPRVPLAPCEAELPPIPTSSLSRHRLLPPEPLRPQPHCHLGRTTGPEVAAWPCGVAGCRVLQHGRDCCCRTMRGGRPCCGAAAPKAPWSMVWHALPYGSGPPWELHKEHLGMRQQRFAEAPKHLCPPGPHVTSVWRGNLLMGGTTQWNHGTAVTSSSSGAAQCPRSVSWCSGHTVPGVTPSPGTPPIPLPFTASH